MPLHLRHFLLFIALLRPLEPALPAGGEVGEAEQAAVVAFFELDGELKPEFRGRDAQALAAVIDRDFAARLYRSPKALAVLGKLFTYPEYAAINARLGQLREEVNLEIWAEIARDFDLHLELNDAGKKHGALSDLDQFLFTRARELPGRGSMSSEEIHRFLIGEHARRWNERLPGTTPSRFDVMQFGSHGLLTDWRMSNAHWQAFSAQLGRQIAGLAGTDGAYFLPGAYKTQVYERYHLEGRTTLIGPVLDPAADPRHRTDLPGLPPGVLVTRELSTRHASELYNDIPFGTDRHGALGAAGQNLLQAALSADTVKEAKYGNRIPNTAWVGLTNLEVDFHRLLVEGRDGVIRYQLQKLFGDVVGDADSVSPLLPDVQSIERIVRVRNRIEMYKVAKGYDERGEPRPAHWTGEWAAGLPPNPNDVRAKLETYFRLEAEEIREALGPENTPPDPELARLAEAAFRRKAHALDRLGAVVTARRMFQDLFTEGGMARQRARIGDAAARRLLVERVKELHALCVFAEDPALIAQILAEAPDAVRPALEHIAEVARFRQKAVLEHQSLIQTISDEWAQLRDNEVEAFKHRVESALAESDAELRGLMRNLGLDPDVAPNVAGQTRLRAGTLSLEYLRGSLAMSLQEALMDRARRLGEQSVERIRTFFDAEIPTTLSARGLLRGTWANFTDIGTLDAVGKAVAAYAAGDTARMQIEIRDAIIENVPLGGQVYQLVKSAKALEKGEAAPVTLFLANKLLAGSSRTAAYGAAMGHFTVLWGLENSLVDVGWQLYARPSLDAAVSLILMGDLSAYRGTVSRGGDAWTGSRLPQFRPETLDRLAAHAILRQRIPLPESSPVEREKILRAHFLTAANHHATTLGNSVPGRHSQWEEDRERELRLTYFRNWEYWMRRLQFYQAVHLDFFAWADRNAGPNWQRVDRSPPSVLEGASSAAAQAEYPDAFQHGLWDHERVHLRRYFRRWLRDWERTQPEHGEFLSHMDSLSIGMWESAGRARPWREAVVDTLIGIYLEGENFDTHQRDRLLKSPGERGTQARTLDQRADSLIAGLADRILEEQGRRRLDKLAQIESLFWNPSLVDPFLTAADAAVGTHTPLPPQLRLHAPRPFGVLGGSLPLACTVWGDPTALPGDLQVELEHQERGEGEGALPSGVLPDDVRRLFGREVPEERLRHFSHDLTVRLRSAEDPSFHLEGSVRVHWLTLRAAEVDPATLADPPPEVGLTDLLERMRRVRERAGDRAAATAAACERMRQSAAQARQHQASTGEALQARQAEVAQLRREGTALRADLDSLGNPWAEIQSAATRLAQGRDFVGKLADNLCRLPSAVAAAASDAERAELLREGERTLAEITWLAEQTRTWLGRMQDERGRIAALLSRLRTWLEAKPRLEQALAGVLSGIDAAASELSAADQQGERAAATGRAVRADQVEGEKILHAADQAVSGLAVRAPSLEEALGTLQTQAEELDRLAEDAEQCPEPTRAAQTEATQSQRRVVDEMSDLLRGLPDLWGVAGSADFQRLESLLSEMDATLAVSEIFQESIDQRVQNAADCLEQARRTAQTPPLVTVPDLRGLDAGEADARLQALALQADRSEGEPAPRPEQVGHVYAQNPRAGHAVDPGATVQMRVYAASLDLRDVPSLLGLNRSRAEDLLQRAGLEAAGTFGRPAQSPQQNGRIYEQNPLPGERVPALSVVRFKVYTAAPEPTPQPTPEPRPTATPRPSATPTPRPAAKPQPAATPLSTPTTASATVPEAAATAPESYVVALSNFMPELPPFESKRPKARKVGKGTLEDLATIFDDDDPELKAEYKEFVKSLTLSQVSSYQPSRSGVLITVSGDGLGAVDRALFTPGASVSIPLEVGIRFSPRTPEEKEQVLKQLKGDANRAARLQRGETLRGALLCKVREVYPDAATAVAAHPDIKAPRSGGLQFVFDRADGTFAQVQEEGPSRIALSGGPIVAGWPRAMKQRNLEMVKAFMDLFCFVGTVVYEGDWSAPALDALRRFRDGPLSRTEPGRRLIAWYYRYGPALAAQVCEHPELWPTLRQGVDWVAEWETHGAWERRVLETAVRKSVWFTHWVRPIGAEPWLSPRLPVYLALPIPRDAGR